MTLLVTAYVTSLYCVLFLFSFILLCVLRFSSFTCFCYLLSLSISFVVNVYLFLLFVVFVVCLFYLPSSCAFLRDMFKLIC